MLKLLLLQGCPIFEQLQLEEALFRASDGNWCVINTGAPPAIVMGVSQISGSVIDEETYLANPIPVVRRFTGGGTVVIEPETVLVSFILNVDFIPVSPFPKEVLAWSASLYHPVFEGLPFYLKENDYTIGERKCGGNAQGFSKKRLVHHTSFLWDYTDAYMNLLKMPPKMPSYRQQRSHDTFLYRLKTAFQTQEGFVERVTGVLSVQFQMDRIDQGQVQSFLQLPHRKATTVEKVWETSLLS